MYKSISVLLLFALCLNFHLYAQDNNKEEPPNIEIVGHAEMEVEPDEIYLNITIKERVKRGEKITIEEQETKMLAGLKTKGISSENIKVSDASLGYVRVKIFKKDVIATKEYVIKASNAEEVKKVMEVLDEVKIKDASIAKVTHSKIKEFKKELRIKAIQDAKEKATYLLDAIGNTLGMPMKIIEVDGLILSGQISGVEYRKWNYDKSAEDLGYSKSKFSRNEIQYNKLKLKADVYVKLLVK